MQKDTRHNLGWAARLRVFARIVGVTGLFAATAGLGILFAVLNEITLGNIRASLQSTGIVFVAAVMMVGGLGLTALLVVLELLSMLGGSGRRSLAGANAMLQVALAITVFVLVNWLTFSHSKRWDLTRNKEFTLPKAVVAEMRELKAPTTIVVLQGVRPAEKLSDADANYYTAAEAKVVEKVRDLVDEFRRVGPQFRVVNLSLGEEGAGDFVRTLDAEAERRPGLREAVAAAPENSVFFYPDERVEQITAAEALRRTTGGRRIHTLPVAGTDKVLAFEGNVPRLGFNEFYQLDKQASREAKPGGNLVLRPQGVEAFARRILAIEEKRPKVGLLVIHEALSTDLSEGWQEQYTNHGLRQSLEAHGFEVVDILMKRWPPREEPTAAAYNKDETRFERLEAELESLEEDIRGQREGKERNAAIAALFKTATLEELNKKIRIPGRREITEEDRQDYLTRRIPESERRVDERIAELEKDRADVEAKVREVTKNERAFEDRRVSDVKAKLTRLVADCDLLIVPRHTLINTTSRQFIDSSLYKFSPGQVEVLKYFMKQGKPILACVGPNNDPNAPPALEPLDDFERLLADRGVELGRQTILYDVESKGYASRQAGNLLGGAPSEIPPVTFPEPAAGQSPNPIARAMAASSRGAARELELRVRHPRPVYLSPGIAEKSPWSPDVLTTVRESWNEEEPFPQMRQVGPREVLIAPPRNEGTLPDDPKYGTRDAEREGPFPVAVAVESVLPAEWFSDQYAAGRQAAMLRPDTGGGILAACLSARAAVQRDASTGEAVPQTRRATGRLVVIGQGGLFSGKQLSAGQEQLLLHSVNWLLRRDDRLPRTDAEWSYPRVQHEGLEGALWKYGPARGLPLLFLWLGAMVWIFRRVR